jgi:hypothetical protein
MSYDKNRIINAIHKFNEKNDPARKLGPKRKNKKPEEEAVKELKIWCKNHGIDIHRYESKSAWNPDIGSYRSQHVEVGHPDLAGSNNFGMAIYIEAKAKGKRSTLREGQRVFLEKKINTGCFAVVSDGADHLSKTYFRWMNILKSGDQSRLKMAREFLLSDLPKKKLKNNKDSDIDF